MALPEVLAAILVLAAATDAAVSSGCQVHVNGGLPNPQPLILRGDSQVPEYLYPSEDDVLNLAMGETMRLLCLGNNTFVHKKAASPVKEVLATCVRGTSFAVDGVHYNFNQFKCKTHAWHEAVRSGTCLNGRYTSIDIGFQVSGEEFLETFQVCFDEENLDPVYSKFTLAPSIRGYQSGFPRPQFSPGKFYGGVDINRAYSRKTQRATIGKLLGSSKLGQQYVQDTGYYFLARGHLTAKADFVFGVQHRSTFYYMNTAPQWQTFNGANWMELENSVRKYIADKGVTVEVTTGIWGIATLPDVSGKEQPLYLYVDENNNHAARVPKYYWKAVYEPATKNAVVFVGMNNPYHKTTPEDIFCKNICDTGYSWITWNATKEEEGYSFCCEVDDFRKTVDTLPAFEVEGLFK